MNRIIICLVTFTSFIKIQAQDQDLTIKGDNFLYIDNTLLYVNKGIDLQDEQTVSEDSSILTMMVESPMVQISIYVMVRSLIQGDNNLRILVKVT